MKLYRTAEIAALIGVHPNTVRFYEQQGLLPCVPRSGNGYRCYSERHLLQLRLIRLAFRAEIVSANLRQEAVCIVKAAANERTCSAIRQTRLYRLHLREEIRRAGEAIALAEQIVRGQAGADLGPELGLGPEWDHGPVLGRREAAVSVGVSVDVLRDWERNGLLRVPRAGNRRRYGPRERNRLKIIRILRGANYSQMAIRRMLQKLERGETDLLCAIDTPEATEDIVSVADRYMTSLSGALRDTEEMLQLLETIR